MQDTSTRPARRGRAWKAIASPLEIARSATTRPVLTDADWVTGTTNDECSGSPSSTATRSPMPAPMPTTTSVVIAPISRALPDARLRVESSVIAVASESPGSRVTSPARERMAVETSYPMPRNARATSAAAMVPMAAAPNSARSSRSRRPAARAIDAPTVNPIGSAANISPHDPPRKNAAPMEKRAYPRHVSHAGGGTRRLRTRASAVLPCSASSSPRATRSATR